MCERVRGEGVRGCGARVPVMVGGVGPVAVEHTQSPTHLTGHNTGHVIVM